MRGLERLLRWQTACVLASLTLVFAGVWWYVQIQREAETTRVPDSTPLTPEAARWEQIGARLHGIRLGMPRAEVEATLGTPDPMNVDAVPKEQTTYHTRYLAFLHQPVALAGELRGFCEVDLTFDASKSGHPLLHITFTPRQPPPSRQTTALVG